MQMEEEVVGAADEEAGVAVEGAGVEEAEAGDVVNQKTQRRKTYINALLMFLELEVRLSVFYVAS